MVNSPFFSRAGRKKENPRSGAFCGVWGVSDPAEALRQFGVEAAWHDARVAFAGATVWTDRTGEIVVSGEVVLTNAPEMCALLELPHAEPGELLAELIRCYGADAGKHALGMFAIAAYDRRTGELLLLRDSVGARTLYYADEKAQGTENREQKTGGDDSFFLLPPSSFPTRGCWFAARLHLLQKCPAVSRELSLPALQSYLCCAFVPGEQTMWRDARELAPGTARLLPSRATRVCWEPRETAWDPDEPLESCARRLRPLLADAVQRVLPASGSVGVFLSGGLDSSLITALTRQAAPGDVHTFAVHFGPKYRNELEFSSLVAAHCRTNHHVLELSGKMIREHLLETMALLDDPIGDPLTVPNLLLARAARQETAVVLNGEGGDPCFGGPKNLPMLLHALYGQTEACESAYLRSFQKCYDDLPRLLTPEVQTVLRNIEKENGKESGQYGRPETLFTPFFDPQHMQEYLNRLMWINVRLKGADHILTKVNNLTTSVGLLAHAPLFDRRVVDMSFAIPPDYKLTGTTEKAVLKRAVADLLPEVILTRPKSGMLVPVQFWFRKDLKAFARAHLLDRHARTRPFLNQAVVREWLNYEGVLFPRHGVKLWLLLSLELWLRAQE